MASPRRSLAFDRVADSYDATRGGESRGSAVADLLLPYLPADPILEVGVGTGLVAAPLAARGRTVLGVDLSRPMLLRAVPRIGARVVQGDAARLPVADGAVPAAYLVWVLHLVADPQAVLVEVARVLPPGGRCVIVPGASLRNAGTDVEELLARMWRRLQPGGRADEPRRLLPLAEAAGLRLAARAEVAVGPRPVSPAELARRIEERSFSVLWEVSDEAWRRDVAPLLAQVRALPEPDRARPTGDDYEILVFDRDLSAGSAPAAPA